MVLQILPSALVTIGQGWWELQSSNSPRTKGSLSLINRLWTPYRDIKLRLKFNVSKKKKIQFLLGLLQEPCYKLRLKRFKEEVPTNCWSQLG